MSSPSWRRQPGPNRGSHQSSDHRASPATGNRPKPTIACWVGSRPYWASRAKAVTRASVELARVRLTEFVRAASSGGKASASTGGGPPSPAAGGGGASGGGAVVEVDVELVVDEVTGLVTSGRGAAVVEVVEVVDVVEVELAGALVVEVVVAPWKGTTWAPALSCPTAALATTTAANRAAAPRFEKGSPIAIQLTSPSPRRSPLCG